MRRVLLLFAALAAFAAAGAQPAGRAEHGPDRETFVYAVRDGDSLRLDRYPALSSAAGARPCMIFLFGGGFLTGTRDNRRFLPYFRHFTARGCDVVSIDYRLGMKRALDAGPIDGERFPGVLASTLAMATEDLRDATAFVCRRAAEWGVDPGGSQKRWTEMDSKCTTPTISRYCRSFSLYNVCDLRHEKVTKRHTFVTNS